MNKLRWVLCMTIMGLSLPAGAQIVLEDFDQSGTSWSVTAFPDLIVSGGGVFTREALGAGLGAPNTSPPLPINQGGDLEGRYFEQTTAISGSYAFTANLPANDIANVEIDGYTSIGNPDPFGSRSTAFLVRANTQGGLINAYFARLTHPSGSQATFTLARLRDSVSTPADQFDSTPVSVNTSAENYRIKLSVLDADISASLYRVTVQAGAVLETLVATLSAIDTELATGRVGVQAFARGGNSIFFDDILITPLSSFDISWHTVDGGGGESTSASFTLNGTIGQPDAGEMSGGVFDLIGGYWGGVVSPLPSFARGECNNDTTTNIADAVYLLSYLFPSGGPPITLACDDACDCNDDGILNIADPISLLTALFGVPPVPLPPPFPGCGQDPPGGVSLGCASSAACP